MEDHSTEVLREPRPRGPLSRWALEELKATPTTGRAPRPPVGSGFSEDLQLALYLCYEGHFGPLPGAPADREWSPAVIAFRGTLERSFEEALRQTASDGCRKGPVRDLIPQIIAAADGPSISEHMENDGTLDEMREFVLHRSAYQLKEGDAHIFVVPGLRGRAKQLLVEIQAGEYGADVPEHVMHAALFAQTMRGLGLDDRPNAYLDVLPASALMISNLVSMFGLNRRWRGALVGHLTVFEMTSVEPMGRYARGLDRLGAPAAARRFYDVHVLADAEHEVIALEMAGALADTEPELTGDVLFGACAALAVEARFSRDLFERWAGAPAIPHASVA